MLTRVPTPHYFLSSHVIKWILPVNSDWTQYELILVKIGQNFNIKLAKPRPTLKQIKSFNYDQNLGGN